MILRVLIAMVAGWINSISNMLSRTSDCPRSRGGGQTDQVVHHERLGGLLSYYYREAA
jgi:hypothetical protein